MSPKPTTESRLLRSDDVYRLTGYSRSTISRLIRAGRFPKPSRPGAVLLFSEAEVHAWIEATLGQKDAA